MNKLYIEETKNEEYTSKTKQPKKELIESILNFSKSLKIEKSKSIGQVEVVLN